MPGRVGLNHPQLTYHVTGDIDGAPALARRRRIPAVRCNPSRTPALVLRGLAYSEMERYEEALADLSRAIELDPNDADSFAERGMTYRAMGRCDEALADFTHVIELDPSYRLPED